MLAINRLFVLWGFQLELNCQIQTVADHFYHLLCKMRVFTVTSKFRVSLSAAHFAHFTFQSFSTQSRPENKNTSNIPVGACVRARRKSIPRPPRPRRWWCHATLERDTDAPDAASPGSTRRVSSLSSRPETAGEDIQTRPGGPRPAWCGCRSSAPVATCGCYTLAQFPIPTFVVLILIYAHFNAEHRLHGCTSNSKFKSLL